MPTVHIVPLSVEHMEYDEHIYRVKDVTEILDRDKTTLFRWEKKGRISPRRDSRGWRIYSQEDLDKMKQLITFSHQY